MTCKLSLCGSLRAQLRHQEYNSIQHFVSIFKAYEDDEFSNIILPSSWHSVAAASEMPQGLQGASLSSDKVVAINSKIFDGPGANKQFEYLLGMRCRNIQEISKITGLLCFNLNHHVHDQDSYTAVKTLFQV